MGCDIVKARKSTSLQAAEFLDEALSGGGVHPSKPSNQDVIPHDHKQWIHLAGFRV